MGTVSINPKTTALLVMDFQRMVVDNYALDKEQLLDRVKRLLAAAREAGLLVAYVVVGFQPSFPEVSCRNTTFSRLKAAGRFAAGDPAAEIQRELTPQPGDVVVTKQRISAFTGTNLEMILRANDIDTLLLAGIATHGVVLSTLCHAVDMDYRAIVVADGCSDRNREVHSVLMEEIFPDHASVAKVEDCIRAMR